MDEKQFAQYKRCLTRANIGCWIEFSIPECNAHRIAVAEIVGCLVSDVDITSWAQAGRLQGRTLLVGSDSQIEDGFSQYFWLRDAHQITQAKLNPTTHNYPYLRIIRNPSDALIHKIHKTKPQ